MPSLDKLHRHFENSSFVLLTVDVGETQEKVKSFLEKHDYAFPVLLDRYQTVSRQYTVRAHPVAYLIDPDGKLIGMAQGYREWDTEEMKALISFWIEKNEGDL